VWDFDLSAGKSSYFSPAAMTAICGSAPVSLDQFTEMSKQILGFSKYDCGKVAAAMTWAEIEPTDVGRIAEEFLSR
jgi:hypothetical protein